MLSADTCSYFDPVNPSHPPPRVLTGRLNVFQRLARTWDAVHPYNAGQACRVAGAFDPGRVEAAWNEALGSLGLGIVMTDGRRFGFEPAPRQAVPWLARDADLSHRFTTELNRPFTDPREPPFRPFAQDVGDSTWLGVTYQHWVADSHSIRLLIRTWFTRLLEPAAARDRPVKLMRLASRAMLGGEGDGVLDLLRRYGEYRRARKVHTMGPLDYPVRVRVLETTRPFVPALLDHARSRGAKLNDVFLAALAQACAALVPAQSRTGRANLALSSAVDLRPALAADASSGRSDFGCLLGFRSTVCRPADLQDWHRLLRSIASRRSRSTGIPWMLAAEFASRFTPPARVYDFYRKETPFAAGISNVNLHAPCAPGRRPPPVVEYVRVSPTGPMVPIAMNVTTLGSRLHLSMTYRRALLNDWTAGEIAHAFVRRLGGIAGGQQG